MSEQSVATEATPVEADSGALGSLTEEQRTEWNKTGELPKTEEAAPSTEPKPKAEAEPAGDSDTPQTQEKPGTKPKKSADERIAELEATIEKIRKGAGKETPKVESSPTKPAELVKQAPQEHAPTRTKPTPEGNGPDGKPYAAYEDYIEDLSDWKGEQREAKAQREAATKAQLDRGIAKVDEAKARYENFEEVVKPFWDEVVVNPDISPTVKALIDDSDYFADLAYTIGSSKEELANFKAMPTGKQIRYIALTESLIAAELDGKKTPTEDTPAKPQTKAPKPPSEAGGRAASPPDALEAAAKSGDFKAFEAESTRRQLAKLKTG